jgi:NADH-quinone oxidoreductase subunit M
MTELPILSIMTWAPFVAGLVVMFFARTRPLLVRLASLAGATVSLVCSLWVYWAYDRATAGFQFNEAFNLVPSLGISYLFAVDGISALMCLLTSIIIFAGVFASWTVKSRSQEFYALLLILTTGVYGVFVSLDLFIFFLFYEIAVLPMYLLIGIWGSSGDVRPQGIFGWAFGRTGVGTKEYAAMKLTLYLLLGSAFILVGILVLFVAGGRSFSLLALQQQQFGPALQTWVFLAFYIGFGVLAGIWPLHTWSPDGHAAAPTAVSMLHAGVLMKLGAYGVVRLGIGLLPQAAVDWAWLVGTIACVNIVYGALSAMAQRDLKYVIAYSSVSHMGVVMLGAATLTENGLNGSVFQMFAHGVMTGLFFALVGLVYEKAHSREIFRMSGFGTMMPGIATAFTVAGLSSLGLPATAGFVAEFLTFLGTWGSAYPWWLFPAVIGAFLTSIYVLRVAGQIFWGAPSDDEHFQHLPDARGTEWAALGILVFVLVLFGVAPGIAIGPVRTSTVPLLDRVDEAKAQASTRVAESAAR